MLQRSVSSYLETTCPCAASPKKWAPGLICHSMRSAQISPCPNDSATSPPLTWRRSTHNDPPPRAGSPSNETELDDQLVTYFSPVIIATLLVLIALFVFDPGSLAAPAI